MTRPEERLETTPQADPVESYAGRRRLGVLAYLAAWAVLAAAQIGALIPLAQAVQAEPRPMGTLAFWTAAVLALQALKIPVTVPRLRDLGRPADDVLWVAVPVMNLVLWLQLFERRPKEAVRRRRIRSWVTQIGALEAYRRGAALLLPTAGTWLFALPAVLVLSAAGEWYRVALATYAGDRTSPAAGNLFSLAVTVAVVSLGWTLLQLGKRHRASRASWFPSLLLVPALMLATGAGVLSAGGSSLAVIVPSMFVASWDLSVGVVVGGLVVAVWIFAAVRAQEGQSTALGDVLRAASPRFGDVIVAWGARTQLVALGAQLAIVGIWFAISWAFTDLVAALRPERPMFGGSTELTRGIRTKIFKMLAIWFLMVNVLGVVALLPVATADQIVATAFDPGALPFAGALVVDVVWWATSWWCLLAMLVVFQERDRLLQEKKQRGRTPAAGASAP